MTIAWAISSSKNTETFVNGPFFSENEALAEPGDTGYYLVECSEINGNTLKYVWENNTWKELKPELTLSKDQKLAWDKLVAWVNTKEPFFILRGFAGTGKTFLLKMLNDLDANKTFVYTATTNKAAKNLSYSVGCPTKTVYSALGLRMEQDEDKLVLTSGSKTVYFNRNTILVIDEAGTSPEMLVEAYKETIDLNKIKIILVGDPYQLPPVGEKTSKVWKLTEETENRALLKEVVRHDNQILALSLRLRQCIKNKDFVSPLVDDHSGDEGVFKLKNRKYFDSALLDYVNTSNVNTCKVAAWRNKTVDYYNNLIRNKLGFEGKYCEQEQILLAKPLKDSEGTIIAHIDDEFRIESISRNIVLAHETEVKTYSLKTTQIDTGLTYRLEVPINEILIKEILDDLANKAKQAKNKREAWKLFWETNDKFAKIRYGYALTAHRLQGSTYTDTWVTQEDVLSNSNSLEAFKCLYVTCTRPTTKLFSY